MTREEFAKVMRDKAYNERVGKVYGDFEVVDIRWDDESKKQVWTMRCTHCGKEREIKSWQNYTNGRVGHCKNCDRVDNTLIGCRNGGFKVNRSWVDDNDALWVEMECERCGNLIKAGYWEYVNQKKRCNCGR